MGQLVERILTVPPLLAYLLIGGLVFAEDALFVGFVVPGETAAVIGGVLASRGRIPLAGMLVLVVAAAIVGDSVGYQLGRVLGPRVLESRLLRHRRERLRGAQDFLARRGGSAVFLGRFVAFFRAVMPALAGISRMPYPRFLAFNAAGGLSWGVGAVLIGYLAGNSYARVEKLIGRGAALGVLAVALGALAAWQVRRHRREAARSG
jgi:membrane-associated protein